MMTAKPAITDSGQLVATLQGLAPFAEPPTTLPNDDNGDNGDNNDDDDDPIVVDPPPAYDVLIQPGEDPVTKMNGQSPGTIYAFAPGIHNASQWSGYIQPRAGDHFIGYTENGILIQNGVVTGRCLSVIRASSDLSNLNWTPTGNGAWQATWSQMPSQLPYNLSSHHRQAAPNYGWVRNVNADNPPRSAAFSEEIWIAEPATNQHPYRPVDTARRFQQQDSLSAVNGNRVYGRDNPHRPEWNRVITIPTCHINFSTKVITISEDPTDKIITMSCRQGMQGKVFGGAANNVTIANLRITQSPSHTQSGPISGGSYFYDTKNKAKAWKVRNCHLDRHSSAALRTSTDWQVTGCLIEQCGQIGAHLGRESSSPNVAGKRQIFSGNIIRHNGGKLCFGFNTEVGGIKASHNNGPMTVSNNWFVANIGGNLWFDVDNQETLSNPNNSNKIRIIENLIEDGWWGIHYELSFGHVEIAHNLVRRNGRFENHGNLYDFTFRQTAQLRVNASSRSQNSSKIIDVHDNVVETWPYVAYYSGTGGGHNSHGLFIQTDGRDKAANVSVHDNRIVWSGANNGVRRSYSGLYADGKATAGNLSAMNSTARFYDNLLCYPGAANDPILTYSSFAGDFSVRSLNNFQNQSSRFYGNQVTINNDIADYDSRAPAPGFRPLSLARKPMT